VRVGVADDAANGHDDDKADDGAGWAEKEPGQEETGPAERDAAQRHPIALALARGGEQGRDRRGDVEKEQKRDDRVQCPVLLTCPEPGSTDDEVPAT